jgi:hypothetical protein
MGMFDYLYSRYKLPGSDLPPETEFQTKDLDCGLEHYVIAADGRLLRCHSRAEDMVELTAAEDTEYHGDIRFYGSGPGGERQEFVARFTHGKLEWVKRKNSTELSTHIRAKENL